MCRLRALGAQGSCVSYSVHLKWEQIGQAAVPSPMQRAWCNQVGTAAI